MLTDRKTNRATFNRNANESIKGNTRFIQNASSLFPKTFGFRGNSNGYSAY